jgi:hypothetical protein
MSLETQRLLVKGILENADRFDWSIQGFGMLRMYLSKEVRLHIWNPAFVVPNVSTIHDHPWDFESEVICGTIWNQRYTVFRRGEDGRMRHDPLSPLQESYDPMEDTDLCVQIRCGTGGGIDKACNAGKPEPRTLTPWRLQTYGAGTSYDQMAADVHETRAQGGTVTIVTRKFKEDTEHARVFFPRGTEWVSAEPRRATPSERASFVLPALALLTKEGLAAK